MGCEMCLALCKVQGMYGWEKKTIRWNSGNNKVLKGMALS